MKISNMISFVEDRLDRIERRAYCDTDIFALANKIDWLYKWGHISREKAHELSDRVSRICEDGLV